MEIGYLCDPDTTASYCPFFLLKRGGEDRQKFLGWMLT
jgi:hypothetical protein